MRGGGLPGHREASQTSLPQAWTPITPFRVLTPIKIETEITRRVIVSGKWIFVSFETEGDDDEAVLPGRTMGTTRAEQDNYGKGDDDEMPTLPANV
jgi:hypothetical protein